VGYLGLKAYLHDKPAAYGVFLETAHPVKFLPAVTPVVGNINLPEQIKELMDKTIDTIPVKNYEELKTYLLA
ncbi:MAG: threonine synthase, partial [Bacteroidia bacterium]